MGNGEELCPACGTKINWESTPPNKSEGPSTQSVGHDEPIEPGSISAMNCGICSSALGGNEKFCPNCGNKILTNVEHKSESVADLNEHQHRSELQPRLPFIDRFVDVLGSSNRTSPLDFVRKPNADNSANGPRMEQSLDAPFDFEKFENYLKSDAAPVFVISALIIAGVGILSTLFPYMVGGTDGSISVGLGLTIEGGFSAGGILVLILSLLFGGIGLIHMTDWVRENKNISSASSGVTALVVALLTFIVCSKQSASISNAEDIVGNSAHTGFGLVLSYLVSVAMAVFGAVCFLNPKFYSDSESKKAME